MAHIFRTPAGTWQTNWRDPTGRKRSKTFKRKRDAERFVAELESARNRGLYIDPHAGKVKFADYLATWVAGRNHEKTTTARDQSIMRTHVVPRWGQTPLVKIDHSSVQAWIADLSTRRSPATVRECHRLLSSVLGLAVRDRTIGHNPCEGVRLPPRRRTSPYDRTITRDTFVRQLLPAIPDRYRALAALAGGTGLRWGECVGLRLDFLDLDGGWVHVRRVAIEVAGRVTSKPYPKTHHGGRSVPLPRFVVAALKTHTDAYSPTRTGEVFANEAGGPPRRTLFRARVWRPALVRAGLLGKVIHEGDEAYRAVWQDMTGLEHTAVFRSEREALKEVAHKAAAGLRFHDLRHSYATWLVYDGVPINDAQKLLGHSRPSTTLDLYTHFQRDLDPRVGDLFAEFSPSSDDDEDDDGPAVAGVPAR